MKKTIILKFNSAFAGGLETDFRYAPGPKATKSISYFFQILYKKYNFLAGDPRGAGESPDSGKSVSSDLELPSGGL